LFAVALGALDFGLVDELALVELRDRGDIGENTIELHTHLLLVAQV